MKQKITLEVGQKIIERYTAGDNPKLLAAEFGITKQNIMSILHGITWKQLIRPVNIEEIIASRIHQRYSKSNLPELTAHQNNLIIGSLLGDGWITKPCDNHCGFRKQQKQLEHIKWLANELKPYACENIYEAKSKYIIVNKNGKIINKKTKVSRKVGHCMYTITHPLFTDLRQEWYPSGKKIIPPSLQLNPEILAIWYVDDGSTSYNNRSLHLSTQSFTLDEVERLLGLLRTLDLTGHVHKEKHSSGLKPSIWFFGDSYDKFHELVKPFLVWECFNYKLKHRSRNLPLGR